MTKLKTDKNIKLFEAFLTLEEVDEVASFCRDLMTEAEINEFASRLEVAKLLDEGKTQRQVSKESGVSIATVTRANQWLNRGMNGYKLVIERLSQQTHHHPHRG